MSFIPADESSLFIQLFRIYVRQFFKWRFKKVWIHQEYHPTSGSRTIYFMNHTTWWDGLIPFLLNEYHFHQQARAFMKQEQMEKYPFFKWMGAFSINADDRSHTLRSLRYAVESMQRSHSSLYIFPQGDIQPVSPNVQFKPGLGWLCKQLPGTDVVPVGIHMHTARYHNPELHLWIDTPMEINPAWDKQQITRASEEKMSSILQELFATAGFEDQPYKKF